MLSEWTFAESKSRAEGRGEKEAKSENVDKAHSSIFDLPMACANKLGDGVPFCYPCGLDSFEIKVCVHYQN